MPRRRRHDRGEITRPKTELLVQPHVLGTLRKRKAAGMLYAPLIASAIHSRVLCRSRICGIFMVCSRTPRTRRGRNREDDLCAIPTSTQVAAFTRRQRALNVAVG